MAHALWATVPDPLSVTKKVAEILNCFNKSHNSQQQQQHYKYQQHSNNDPQQPNYQDIQQQHTQHNKAQFQPVFNQQQHSKQHQQYYKLNSINSKIVTCLKQVNIFSSFICNTVIIVKVKSNNGLIFDKRDLY